MTARTQRPKIRGNPYILGSTIISIQMVVLVTMATKGVDSSEDRAPPIGRIFRLLVGGGLLALAAQFWVGIQLPLGPAGIALGLILSYIGVQFSIARFFPEIHRWVGALLALLPAGIVYMVGGELGQIGVLTFLGLSMVVAGIRGYPGCEVLAIPSLLLGRRSNLACILFTPTDWVERRLIG